MSVLSIPEVTLHILLQLSPSRYDDTSVRTLIACTKTSRTLREAAQTDSLWAEHYRARWTKPELDLNEPRQWYELYCTRRETDVQTLALLDTIITTPSKRGSSAVGLVNLGEYAWDVLRMEATSKVPDGVRDVWKREESQWVAERWEGIGEEWIDGTGKRDVDEADEREANTRTIRPDWIQRRWWAKQALGTLARTTGLVSMVNVFHGPQPDPTSFENARNFGEGLKALSDLMGINTCEVNHNYDNLAKACRDKLIQDGVCVDPADDTFHLMKFSRAVCDFMKSQGFRKAEGDGQYYDLMNHFPHTFMTTNRRTLPISLVCTFVAIVTRLGLRAVPVGFPGHVHAWVALPSYQQPSRDELSDVEQVDWEQEEPLRRLHVDVFNSDTEPFLASATMRDALGNLQVPQVQWGMLMNPSPASEMIMRAANNILHSVTRSQHHFTTHVQTETRAGALYAATMTFLIARPQAADAARFVGGVVSAIKEQFPLDTEPVLSRLLRFVSGSGTGTDSVPEVSSRSDPAAEEGTSEKVETNPSSNPSPRMNLSPTTNISPNVSRPNGTNPEIAMHLRNSIARLRESRVDAKKRKSENYWTGMVFKHAKYNYVGVITGWDDICKAEERWIIEAGVDRLPRGRAQPFYTILAADGSSRYVAEENVIQLPSLATAYEPEHKLSWEVVQLLSLADTSTIESAFTRVEVDEGLGRAWFVPAVSTAEEYPDDMERGREYMQKPWHRY